ncbi:receptor-like protein 18 [Pistacia vera]|uniref:receptor-like protein 18 n=1 Tax=Pistacia vera TaxID=55513 RepID=UPI001263180E|nr:receptor-like protein 18 [Pistacia vera]
MVPKSLANCAKLEILNIGNNQFSDTFPCWLNNVFSLHILVLRSNKFHGEIDCPELKGSWPMLQIFDLASNRFSGRLPQKYLTTWVAMMADSAQSELKHLQFEILALSSLYYQDEVTVTSKGLQMELVKILTVFTSIDLSCNNFQGPIPAEIGLLKSLHILNLSYNAFTGPLPSSVENMRQLESLDLSVNNLTGVIPAQLASLNFLSFLNVSYNHFVGKIPTGTQLQSFLSTSFEGNKGLCGPPLTTDCTNSSMLPPPPPASPNSEIDWLFIMMAIGFAVGFGAVVAPLMFSKKVNKWYDDCISKYMVKFVR